MSLCEMEGGGRGNLCMDQKTGRHRPAASKSSDGGLMVRRVLIRKLDRHTRGGCVGVGKAEVIAKQRKEERRKKPNLTWRKKERDLSYREGFAAPDDGSSQGRETYIHSSTLPLLFPVRQCRRAPRRRWDASARDMNTGNMSLFFDLRSVLSSPPRGLSSPRRRHSAIPSRLHAPFLGHPRSLGPLSCPITSHARQPSVDKNPSRDPISPSFLSESQDIGNHETAKFEDTVRPLPSTRPSPSRTWASTFR